MAREYYTLLSGEFPAGFATTSVAQSKVRTLSPLLGERARVRADIPTLINRVPPVGFYQLSAINSLTLLTTDHGRLTPYATRNTHHVSASVILHPSPFTLSPG